MTIRYVLACSASLAFWVGLCIWLVERERSHRRREAEWSSYRRALIAMATPSPRSLPWVAEDAAGRNFIAPGDGPACRTFSERSNASLGDAASTARPARVPLGSR